MPPRLMPPQAAPEWTDPGGSTPWRSFAAALRAGRLVAFGTETVYGLGGRADRPATIAAIYAAKRRPAHNPLICHYAQAEDAARDAEFTPAAWALAAAFWPGPLTLVLPRRPAARPHPSVSPTPTLAVRIPQPAATRALLHAVGAPVAAPSANLSGRVSPTTAAHVLDQLAGLIAGVFDTGPCTIGLESTVIDLTGATPALLRPGAIPAEAIAACIGTLAAPSPLPSTPGAPRSPGPPRSPGLLASHYAPLLPLRLDATICHPQEALLAFGPAPAAPLTYQLSAAANLAEAAARLFDGLRSLDKAAAAAGLRAIAAMPIPTHGLGCAINDRLVRAAYRP